MASKYVCHDSWHIFHDYYHGSSWSPARGPHGYLGPTFGCLIVTDRQWWWWMVMDGQEMLERGSGSILESVMRFGMVCEVNVRSVIFWPILSRILADRYSRGERVKAHCHGFFSEGILVHWKTELKTLRLDTYFICPKKLLFYWLVCSVAFL